LTAVVTDFDPGRARTAVKLHSLAVRLPSTTGRTPQTLESHQDIVLTTAAPKKVAEKPYSFEFMIDGRNELTARRNDFEATLATELAVSYSDPELRVGGYIEFRRGSFELFGKHFDLSRGSMQFDGGDELNPDVSLVAMHRPNTAGSSTVTVNVSGTLARPTVSFQSDRCPGDGAVVLLVSGRCPNESDIAMTDPNATQNAFAYGILGGILTLGAQSQGWLRSGAAVHAFARRTRVCARCAVHQHRQHRDGGRAHHQHIARHTRFPDRAVFPEEHRRRWPRRSNHAQLGCGRDVGTMSDAHYRCATHARCAAEYADLPLPAANVRDPTNPSMIRCERDKAVAWHLHHASDYRLALIH
jgi:TamB, inner membrane protein subunit of TAM complex